MPTRIAPRSRRCRVSARVSMPLMPTTPCALQLVVQAAHAAPARRHARGVADDVARHPDPRGLRVLVVDAGVADVRRGHDHDLAVVGRVGQRLLVAGHAGVEDRLAERLALGAVALAGEGPAVLEDEDARRQAWSSRSPSPPHGTVLKGCRSTATLPARRESAGRARRRATRTRPACGRSRTPGCGRRRRRRRPRASSASPSTTTRDVVVEAVVGAAPEGESACPPARKVRQGAVVRGHRGAEERPGPRQSGPPSASRSAPYPPRDQPHTARRSASKPRSCEPAGQLLAAACGQGRRRPRAASPDGPSSVPASTNGGAPASTAAVRNRREPEAAEARRRWRWRRAGPRRPGARPRRRTRPARR